MTEFIIRLVLVFGVAFGGAYGIARAVKSSRAKKRDQAREQAREKLAALKRSLEEQEISVEEYDQLSRQIYKDCQDKGIEIEDL